MSTRTFFLLAMSLVLALSSFEVTSAFNVKAPVSLSHTTPRTLTATTKGVPALLNADIPFSTPSSSFQLRMSANDETPAAQKSNLPMLLDPGTKGGALFLSLVLFIIPIIIYEVATVGFGFDEIDTGKWIGVGFTFFTTVLWVGTYIFRVATKDMTYAKQLKDYENAVIAKRLEELDEDEIQALVEDIERDDF